ncbi:MULTISPECIES: hypothetical protein [Pseudoalteromonas]|uniref:Uncharacterized protein n=1 Tax=Pseudoalteromonas luteoviolacea (strain 2ta16) TaxID=1353533 RepID=V4H8J7_PSEL2|nr:MULTISPECIES: hypothetical protein [Pseudoalteromonas]ESP93791.1 hypothetical protein PL2TA16_02995 [Pseudoalteromonas luteoviolacea 2ta16]KZN41095.1 hypothetical protein N483_15915 [Pseudoalteromonas luteoviolacea NCIMB 1944]MCG7550761.1 hypothetical protein [Pseudoalteromonas sp. Of7M-16]
MGKCDLVYFIGAIGISFNTSAATVFSDFSDRVDIPDVESVSIENTTQSRFNDYLEIKQHQSDSTGAIYSALTPDEQVKYKYQKGILRSTVTFESLQKYTYDVTTSPGRVEKQTHFIFWE